MLVAGMGFLLMVGAVFVSQDTLEGLAPFLYGLAAVLLVAVLLIGVGKTGERRWFDLGFLRFQPSELAKYAVIFALARYLARRKTRLDRPVHLLDPAGHRARADGARAARAGSRHVAHVPAVAAADALLGRHAGRYCSCSC